ncbi:hypothetical protein KFL_002640095 [Klebsormidium nitens]|uniref:Uncharacterized protein n=1 Tax=Klebsormidium nitens TaxID=105231 RepID=A0A0U9HMT1_KLENI|nr:hypothetical protein KFL_002640095 [Klebsormidium nitens]|eukprot:GAQ85988.1 hypothetical protein KFL_002640095 [Klebsormidium nitens]
MWRRFLQRRWPGYPSYRASVILFDELAAYERPRSLTPLLLLNVVGFYSGVVAAALTEQLYKERYWEEHPGQAVPTMRSWTYLGPHKVRREDFAEEEGRE